MGNNITAPQTNACQSAEMLRKDSVSAFFQAQLALHGGSIHVHGRSGEVIGSHRAKA